MASTRGAEAGHAGWASKHVEHGNREIRGGRNGPTRPENGNGSAAAGEEEDGRETGEIAVAGDREKREEGEAGEREEGEAGEREMEADKKQQQPPKEDLMVDYTDEFGRIRTMLQR